MKIDYSKIIKKDIEKLLLDKNMNIAAADGLFEYCFYTAKKRAKVEDFLELNLDDQEDKYFYQTRILPAIKEIKISDYQDNYYRKKIKPEPYKGHGYELAYLTVKPYQCLPYDDIDIDKDYVEVSRIGYFKEPFSYLAVMKDNVVWMSTDPNEINTMKQPISGAKGRVLTFGLGLGYFAIMCAKKEDVSSVTIIEKDPKIIEIFKKHILPTFEFKDKIHIIEADAIDYTRKNNLSDLYDYLFIDIWHNPEDGLPLYLKFKRLLKNEKLVVSYWLEKSILAMYRRCLLTIIEENMMGYTKKNYLKSENEYDDIINELYFKTENVKFSSIDEIKRFLQDNNLLKLI